MVMDVTNAAAWAPLFAKSESINSGSPSGGPGEYRGGDRESTSCNRVWRER